MAVYDQTLIEQIQRASDIVDIVGEHVSLTRKGREMVGLCPFHDDHRPSMNVSPHKQIFKCFACGAGGDVFKFVQLRENLSFPQAVERLAERAGIAVEQVRSAKVTADPNAVDPNRLARANTWAAKYFEGNLWDEQTGASARRYLEGRRIGAEEAKKWGIGLACDSPAALLAAARARRIPDAVLLQSGLTVGNQDKFVNRLMFPIADATGRIVGFGGRTLGDAPAKYVNSPTTPLFDKSNCLYGLNHARHEIVRSGVAVVVEGYTDCIMSHSKGITNAVATLGTSFTSGHGRILRRYAKKVILVFDGDTAGVTAANRALEVALAQRIDVGIAIIPAGQDPCDYLLAKGADAFGQLIDNATDVFDFKWSRLEEAFARDETLAGRKAAIDEFLQAVATALGAGNLNAIETGLLVNRLARVLSMDPAAVAAELRTRTGRVQRAGARTVANAAVSTLPPPATLAARAQSEIIEVLLCDPSLFSTAAKRLTVDDFDVPELASIARIVFDVRESGRAATVDTVLRQIESKDTAAYVVDLEHAGQAKGNFARRLDDALDVLDECGPRRRAGAATGPAQREKTNRYRMGMT